MVSFSDLPYAVARQMTAAQISAITPGSVPNGTIIEELDTGKVVVIQSGLPRYLPYLTQAAGSDFISTKAVNTDSRVLLGALTESGYVANAISPGTDGQVLAMSGGVPAFVNAGGKYLVKMSSAVNYKNVSSGAVSVPIAVPSGCVAYSVTACGANASNAVIGNITADSGTLLIKGRNNGVIYESQNGFLSPVYDSGIQVFDTGLPAVPSFLDLSISAVGANVTRVPCSWTFYKWSV